MPPVWIPYLSEALSLCQQILNWFNNLAEKKKLLVQLSATVQQVYNILLPFSTSQLRETNAESHLSDSVRAVGNVLRNIEKHLREYKSKSGQKRVLGFLNPGSVVQKLKEDQRRLNHQLTILNTSIATVTLFHIRGRDNNSSRALGSKSDDNKWDNKNWISTIMNAVFSSGSPHPAESTSRPTTTLRNSGTYSSQPYNNSRRNSEFHYPQLFQQEDYPEISYPSASSQRNSSYYPYRYQEEAYEDPLYGVPEESSYNLESQDPSYYDYR